jgi:SAM-dependent methyltransferase
VYDLLFELSQRPQPFSRYTAKELWTRPHLAGQMLRYHLSQETELASRPTDTIGRVVGWIDAQIPLNGLRLCDLGCGPGLYSQRFAALGAEVTGVDFSKHSLDYARSHGEHPVRYIEADYLTDELPGGFDLITLIYYDLCPLSPEHRGALLGRAMNMLAPGGRLVMDVVGTGALDGREDSLVLEHRLMGGFWAAGDYVGIHRAHVYPEERLSLDHYLIVEPDQAWQIFNWLQYFTPQSIEAELNAAGFKIEQIAGDLTGAPLVPDGDSIGIIAVKTRVH